MIYNPLSRVANHGKWYPEKAKQKTKNKTKNCNLPLNFRMILYPGKKNPSKFKHKNILHFTKDTNKTPTKDPEFRMSLDLKPIQLLQTTFQSHKNQIVMYLDTPLFLRIST
jgi:hypothetical protein